MVMDAVKKGFGVATKNLGLVSILFVFNLIWNLASIPLAAATGAGTQTPQLNIGVLLFSILFILISIFVQSGSMGTVRDYIKEGRAKLAGFAAYGLKYYLRILSIGVIIMAIIVAVALIAALIVAATAPVKNTAITAVAAILAIIIGAIGLYFVVLLMLSPYILVCDEAGVINSMKKSVATVRKALGGVLLLLLVIILISLGIGFLIGFITGILSAMIPTQAGQIVMAVVNSLFNGYIGIVMMAAFMSFYLGLSQEGAKSKVL